MHDFLIASAVFVCLVAASLGGLALSARLPARYHEDDTNNVVRLAANIFVVAASLVLGLLLNSAKNTFESVDRNVHSFATELILLDQTLRQFGPEGSGARERLAQYLRRAIDGTWPAAGGAPLIDDRSAERLLDEVGSALEAIRPSDPARAELWNRAHADLQNVVRRRWALIEESDGTIPGGVIVMLVAWLVLVLASFGYRAPRNAVVVTTLVAASFLIAGSIYLVLDMDFPLSGTIQVLPAPLLRAEAVLRR